MKRFLCNSAFLLLTLAAVAASGAPPTHDGNWWGSLSHDQKIVWSAGWWDGVMIGGRILGGAYATDEVVAYEAALQKLKGVSVEQILQGIDQFYAADFRNLSVKSNDVALLVTMYANGLSPEQAGKVAAELRDLHLHGVYIFDN